MVEIVSEPYRKTYVFPIASFTFLTRLLLIVLTVAAPFFIVYKTGSIFCLKKTFIRQVKRIISIYPK